MKTKISVLAVAGATLVAVATAVPLAGAGSAAVRAEPRLSVAPQTSALSAGGTTVLHFQDQGDNAVASIEVYAPAGYGVDLSQPVGTSIGTVEAQVKTWSATEVHRDGLIKVADPTSASQAASVCTPQRLVHDAVWMLGFNGGGLPAEHIPAFVDRAPAGAGAAQPSVQLRVCLPPPSATEARLVDATLTLSDVFTNPTARGDYRWTTVFTTHVTAGQPPAAPTSSQTIVRIPAQLTLTKKVIRATARRRSYVRLTGVLSENLRGISGARVEITAGAGPRALRRLVFVTTFTHGRFSLVAPLRRATLFQAHASVPVRSASLARCESFSLRPDAECTSVVIGSATADSRVVRAVPKARLGRVRP